MTGYAVHGGGGGGGGTDRCASRTCLCQLSICRDVTGRRTWTAGRVIFHRLLGPRVYLGAARSLPPGLRHRPGGIRPRNSRQMSRIWFLHRTVLSWGSFTTPRLFSRPSKHKTFNQCWFNVGPPSTTTAQHWTNIGSMSRVCWDIPARRELSDFTICGAPSAFLDGVNDLLHNCLVSSLIPWRARLRNLSRPIIITLTRTRAAGTALIWHRADVADVGPALNHCCTWVSNWLSTGLTRSNLSSNMIRVKRYQD